MPIPNLALTLSVGGAVASSLPSSLKRTTREIDALREKAAEDRAELKRLSAELRTLEKGTDEYNQTAQQVQSLKDSLAETGAAQRDLVVRQRELQDGAASLGRAMGRMGGVVAGVTGGVIAGVLAITAYSNRLRSFAGLAAQTGGDMRQLDRDARALGVTLGDADLGRAAIQSLAELRQQGRSLQADFAAAGIAGIDIDRLQAGRIELSDIQRVLADIAAEGDTINSAIRRDALAGLVGPDLLQAAAEMNSVSDETLLLRQRLAGASDASLRMRDSVAQGLTPVLTPLFGVVERVSNAIADSSGATRGFIGVVAVGGAVVGGLITAVSAAGFVYIGLKNAVDAARVARTALTATELRATAVSKIGAVATGARAAVQGVLTASLFTSVAGWVAATVAAIGFNVATGGVLLAIGALIAGVILLVKNWDTVKAAVVGFIERFTLLPALFGVVSGAITALGEVAGPVFTAIFNAIKPVADLVQGLVSGIGRVAGVVGRFLGFGGGSEDSAPGEDRRPPRDDGRGGDGRGGPPPSGMVSARPAPMRMDLPAPEQLPPTPVQAMAARGQPDEQTITEITNHFTITGVADPEQVARQVVRILERGEAQIVSTRGA